LLLALWLLTHKRLLIFPKVKKHEQSQAKMLEGFMLERQGN